MATTRTGPLVEQDTEEQAKVNASNAKIVRMNQVKTKMSNLQTKLECTVSKLKGTFMDYRDEVGAEVERDASVVVIVQKNWDKMETLGTELNQ